MNKMTVPVAVAVSALFLIASILTSVAIFGGVPVGPITQEELPQVEAWIAWNDLDSNGVDPTALHEYSSTIFQNNKKRLDYIRSNHRDRPWLNIPSEWLTALARDEIQLVNEWISINDLNRFGGPVDTVYAGGTPLFDELTGKNIQLDEYLLKNYPTRPWIWSRCKSQSNGKEHRNE